MQTLITAAWGTGVVVLTTMILTILSSGDTVRDLIQRFFLIVLALPEIIRDGCRYVIDRARQFFQSSADSVGITGEHWIQRIIGTILFAICTAVGVFVAGANLMVTLGGTFGSGEELMKWLPVSLETMMAVELVCSAVLFGMLLLDIMGITHLVKFFSPTHLNRFVRYTFGVIFVLGIVFSFYLGSFVIGGIRTQSMFLEDIGDVVSAKDIQASANQPSVYTPNSKADNHQVRNMDTYSAINIPAEGGLSEGYIKSLNILMVGIPLVSFVSGMFGAVAAIPFLAVLMTGLVLIAALLVMGPPWLIGHIGFVLINLIYNFIYNLLNIFIQTADSIRGWLFGGDNNGGGENNTPADNSARTQTPAEDTSSNDTETQEQPPMYEKNDVNWNPLT